MGTGSLIKQEITAIHLALLLSGKLLIGIGVGVLLSSREWLSQSYWYLLILLGVLLLGATLISLMKAEVDEERDLRKNPK